MDRVSKAGLGVMAAALAVFALPAATALAAGEEAPAKLTDEQVVKARQLFSDNGCIACHTLADANAAGSVGPSFDGDVNLDKNHAIQVISTGQGPMPNFSWLGEDDIDLLASYIVQVKK